MIVLAASVSKASLQKKSRLQQFKWRPSRGFRRPISCRYSRRGDAVKVGQVNTGRHDGVPAEWRREDGSEHWGMTGMLAEHLE